MSSDSWPTGARPLLIGLTGPIGCGKSTVGAMLRELGGMVVDADVLARRATEPGRPTLLPIRERFGDAVFDEGGELDRGTLARLVFEDPEALAALEHIIHPEVRGMVEQLLETAARDQAPFAVIEAIKLVEGGLAGRCDEVWLIECSAHLQRSRLSTRGADRADIDRRLEAQGAGLVDRLEVALEETGTQGDRRPRIRRISTDGSLENVRERIEDALADAIEADRA